MTEDKQPKSLELGELGLHQLPGQLIEDVDFNAETWYQAQPQWPERNDNGLRATKSKWSEIAGEALSCASRIFDKRSVNSNISQSKNMTISDKIATYTLAVQESPVYRIDELQTLLSFAKKRGQERTLSLEALKDLFISNLLPDNRRLVSFHDRSFVCERSALSKRHLIYALFESELKTMYREYIQILEECGRDNLPFIKKKSLENIFHLLAAKPENEKLLLSILVNKLGDPDKSISSTSAHKLSKLICEHHPQMRFVVVREVTDMLRRPNINRRAQYYAVSFLNQIPYRSEDTELARMIVQIYMDLFVMCHSESPAAQTTKDFQNSEAGKEAKKKHTRKKIKKKQKREAEQEKQEITEETQNSKFMAALLIGVNRAYPFTKPDQDNTSYEKHYKNLFRIAHTDSFGPSTQALALLLQIAQSNSFLSDRLYKVIYDRIADVPEIGERVQASFLHLVLKAVSSDTDSRRVKAFVKRLLQSALSGSSAYAGACMVLLFELSRRGHHTMLSSFLSLPENDDEDEVFFDADKLNESNGSENALLDLDLNDPESESESPESLGGKKKSVVKKDQKINDDDDKSRGIKEEFLTYDPKKRDPKYARADRSSLWEAVSLAAHYHPSVSMFASSLCSDLKESEINGDPLRDYSLITFLDRFCYKRSKNRIKKSLYGKASSRFRDNPIANSAEFQRLVESGQVEEDDKFLAKFFQQNPGRVVKEEAEDGFASGSDVDSEEEAYEQAIEAEMKRLGADVGKFGRGPDIDDEDEDELKEFDKAFGKEMVDSDDDDDEDDDSNENGSGSEHDNDLEVLPLDRKQPSHKSDAFSSGTRESSVPSMNIFAPAEDYEDAINEDLIAAQKEMNEAPTADAESEAIQHKPARKRRKAGRSDRPNKKRRNSKT